MPEQGLRDQEQLPLRAQLPKAVARPCCPAMVAGSTILLSGQIKPSPLQLSTKIIHNQSIHENLGEFILSLNLRIITGESLSTKEQSTPKKWGCTEWLYTLKEYLSHMIEMSVLQ